DERIDMFNRGDRRVLRGRRPGHGDQRFSSCVGNQMKVKKARLALYHAVTSGTVNPWGRGHVFRPSSRVEGRSGDPKSTSLTFRGQLECLRRRVVEKTWMSAPTEPTVPTCPLKSRY